MGDKKQSNANNVNNFQAKLEIQNVTISSASCGLFIDLFSKLITNNLSFNNILHHRAINNIFTFILRNKQCKFDIFLITNSGGGDSKFLSSHAAKHVWVAVITN